MEVVVTKWNDVIEQKNKKGKSKFLILFVFICIIGGIFIFKKPIMDLFHGIFNGVNIYYMKGNTYCVIDDKIGKEEILNEDEFNKKAIINPHQTYFQTENDMVYYYDVDKKIVSLIAANSFVLQTDNIFNYNETMLMTKGEKVFYGTYDDVSKNTCTLYIKELDKPAVKIDNDVSIIYGAFSNENFIYYGKTLYEEVKYSDYIIDDISDESFINNEPKITDFKGDEKIIDGEGLVSYIGAKTDYKLKQNFIDNNEEVIKNYIEKIATGSYVLEKTYVYAYDGKNTYKLTENPIATASIIKSVYPNFYFEMCVDREELGDNKKNKLSDIILKYKNIDEFMENASKHNWINEYIYEKMMGMKLYDDVDGKILNVYKLKNNFVLTSKIDNNINIYEIDNKKNNVELIDSIDTDKVKILSSDKIENFYYISYNKNGIGNLYDKNSNLKIENISYEFSNVSNDYEKIYYIKNYTVNNKSGELYIIENENHIKIDDNVYGGKILINPINNDIYYIKNYDIENKCGELYKSSNYKNKFLASEVSDIVDIYNHKSLEELFFNNKKDSIVK